MIATIAALSALSSALVEPPVVMVVGTYHFANPGLDLVKTKIRDTMGADRQKEIADLNDRLAKFKPTKIFIEVTPDREPSVNDRFKKYVDGTYELTANETDQIAFRLAKQLGHNRLIAVDRKLDMKFDGVFAAAQKNGQANLLGEVQKAVGAISKAMEDMDAKFTVPQLIAIHNAPEAMRQSQSFYVKLVAVNSGDRYEGADMLADWYRRNLYIYANIRRELKPGDRAMVLYGSGHAYFLNQVFADAGDVKLVSPLEFLPKPPITSIPLGG